MPEETTTTPGATPAVTPATPQPQAGTTTSPEPQAGDGNSEQISLEEAKKLRKEAQTLRNRLKSYEDADEAKKLAALSDVEKANKKASELQQKYDQAQKQLINTHVKLAAQTKGIIDPDLAALAIQDKLEYGDDGMPSNLDKALDELLKNKPYLGKPAETQTTPAQTASNRATPQIPAMNPGRSQIQQPGQNAPQKRYKLSELL